MIFGLYWLLGNKVKGGKYEADSSASRKLICQCSPFLPPAGVWQINDDILSSWTLHNTVLPTASDNSSVSAHENLTPSYLIIDMHTYFHPSYFPYFCFFFFFFCYLLKNVKLLVLAGLEENKEREGYGSPLASVRKGLLKNLGSRFSLVCSTGDNLTWKLSLYCSWDRLYKHVHSPSTFSRWCFRGGFTALFEQLWPVP